LKLELEKQTAKSVRSLSIGRLQLVQGNVDWLRDIRHNRLLGGAGRDENERQQSGDESGTK
jgi:hypothetical protein